MADSTIAHRAASLPWLCPAAPALATLALDAPDVAAFRDCPASVLLLVRYSRPTPTIESINFSDFHRSSILESAAAYLQSNVEGWHTPSHPQLVSLHRYARRVAAQAESLAAVSGTCNPLAARVAGLLAPVGLLAMATVAPDLVEACLKNPDHLADPIRAEQLYWGLSADAITRRLVSRWKLPAWLGTTLSSLRLPVKDAIALGADADLTRVLRYALASAECPGEQYAIRGKTDRLEETERALETETTIGSVKGIDADTDPRTIPLLPALMKSVARSRRASGQNRTQDLETQIDQLQTTLTTVRQEFDIALRDAKLVSLAEFAAGAGHEINNPLAVISGNAQLLRSREEDADRRRTLDVIIRQTGRIAELLHDVMGFARPARPNRTSVHAGLLFQSILTDHAAAATLKQVDLRIEAGSDAYLATDIGQVRKALGNLIRNAIEHTPSGGRVQVYARPRNDSVELIVEDTGPGPVDESIPHLFDPFFSGHSAGRGRGLGLATAWRFAQENGGTLRYDRPANGPTRFVLSLPASRTQALPERISA